MTYPLHSKLNTATQNIFIFISVTFVYLFLMWVNFKGFNGTDDLHYSMLASNLLKNQYDPFNANDIFSGRLLLIYTQALIYYIGGINIFTTQIGCIFITILCNYLTIFKLGKISKGYQVLLASALFYFNPVLEEATIGVMPDAYVMLMSIFILLLWQKIDIVRTNKTKTLLAVSIGSIGFLSLLFKENSLVFIPTQKTIFDFIVCTRHLFIYYIINYLYNHCSHLE